MYDDINDKDWWRLVKRISLVIGVIVLVPALIVPLFITVFSFWKAWILSIGVWYIFKIIGLSMAWLSIVVMLGFGYYFTVWSIWRCAKK